MLPKHLDEKVATLHLDAPGVYTFVMVEGVPGHSIGFDELPNIDRVETRARTRVGNQTPLQTAPRLNVYLPKGSYTLDCNVPGHAAAGELLHVIVG